MSGVLPSDWFLTSSETRFQPSHTSGNAVVALLDGKDYMDKLLSGLRLAGSNGYIHLSGWRLTPQVKLLGDIPNSPTIKEVIEERSQTGATIRSLLWMVPLTFADFAAGHGIENLESAQNMEALNEEVVLDERLPNIFSSHHQKYCITGDGNNHIGFIGGMDIALDRWDTSEHNDPVGRQKELFDGWHDVQAQLEGPAVAQLWDCFFERWNDPRVPNGTAFTAGGKVPVPIPVSERPNINGNGTCHVQIVCTYPCKTRIFSTADQPFYPFAPSGDHSYEKALIKAIDSSEKYVYIEDQYFWPCKVVDALVSAAARGVTIILLVTNNYDVSGLAPFHNFMRQSSIDKVKRSGSIFVYTLKQNGVGNDDIYVHSKTMIVDDRYAIIGTANINQRSMTTDTEIAVAIVDADIENSTMNGQPYQVNKFAKEYRMKLWLEHLKISIDDPLNSNGTPAGWPTSISQPVHHANIHVVPDPKFCNAVIIPFMNPQTVCI